MPAFELLPSADGLWTDLRGLDGRATALVVQRGLIRWAGAPDAMPAEYAGLPVHAGGGALLTPGLVDCHTHLV